MAKYFRFPFGVTGDREPVPDVATGGEVGYDEGYGEDYSRNRATDPLAKNIERLKLNQIMYDVTDAVKAIQEYGAPEFITSAANGGVPFSYAKGAIVRYGDKNYYSLIASNTSLPDTASWQELSSGATTSVENIFRPEDYATGTPSYADSSSTGENLGGGLFRDLVFPFTAADVGKSFWQDAATTRTITAVDGAGVATISPAPYGTTGINYVKNGYDWTPAIQAAIDAAHAVSGDASTGLIINFGPPRMGGVVVFGAGKRYGVTNSSAQYSGGKLSSIVLKRRITMRSDGVNEGGSYIVQLPFSYGHVMAPATEGSNFDFFTLADITIEGFGDFSPNSLNGVDFYVRYDEYAKVDPYNRFQNVTVRKVRQDGFRFRGRGELKIRDCDAFNCTRYGLFTDSQWDWTMIGGQFGGNGRTGLRLSNGSPGNFTLIKSFYNGVLGGTNDADCANLAVVGDGPESGFIFGSNFQLQESRGSGLVVTVGNVQLYQFQALDPARTALSGGTLPTILAGVYIKGQSSNNELYGRVSPSVTFYSDPNWTANTYSVYVDDYTGAGGGPQLNSGFITTYRSTFDAGPTVRDGTEYTGSGAAKGGGGVTNGKNSGLYIDNVPCAATLGATPASGDLIEVIDVSDTTNSVSGTKKLVAFSNFGGGGGGSMAIGGSITGATEGSVLFSGASGVLAQDNANLFWNDTSNCLGVGTATPNASCAIDIVSTTKGLGLPSMTNTQRDAIVSPRTGTIVYDNVFNQPYIASTGGWRAICIKYVQSSFFTSGSLAFGEQGVNGTSEVTITAPASLSANRTQTFQDRDGTIALDGNAIAAVATTSGTSFDYTSIPTWARKVKLMVFGVSTNGSANLRVQLGNGSIVTSGYVGACISTAAGQPVGGSNLSAGFDAQTFSPSASSVYYGYFEFTKQDGNTWICEGKISQSASVALSDIVGGIALAGVLDRIRLTTDNGTDTFDAGTYSLLIE